MVKENGVPVSIRFGVMDNDNADWVGEPTEVDLSTTASL
jgi:hypothetical protein